MSDNASKKSTKKARGVIRQYQELSDKELFSLYTQDKQIDIRNELIQRNLYIAEILSKK